MFAGLSIDLDDHWAYRRSFGFADWKSAPSLLPLGVPRFLSLRDEAGWKGTVFVVGRDADMVDHREIFRQVGASGLEIGNHSYWHRPGLQDAPPPTIEAELHAAEKAILAATGYAPRGFRGPAYATSTALLQSLMTLGYRYDASSFPTSIGPLARLYQRALSRPLSRRAAAAGKDAGERLDIGFTAARGSLRPYCWTDGQRRLLEIPVTTMPFTRLPIHMTYLNFLADRSTSLARRYLQLALQLCLRTDIRPSLLLHATDFIGSDDRFDLAFVPGMRRRAQQKIDLARELLSAFARHYELLGLDEYADRVQQTAVPERALSTAGHAR